MVKSVLYVSIGLCRNSTILTMLFIIQDIYVPGYKKIYRMSYILYFLNLKINCINNHTPPRRKTSTDITVSISSAPSASKTAAVFILEDCVQKLRISRASVQL